MAAADLDIDLAAMGLDGDVLLSRIDVYETVSATSDFELLRRDGRTVSKRRIGFHQITPMSALPATPKLHRSTNMHASANLPDGYTLEAVRAETAQDLQAESDRAAHERRARDFVEHSQVEKLAVAVIDRDEWVDACVQFVREVALGRHPAELVRRRAMDVLMPPALFATRSR